MPTKLPEFKKVYIPLLEDESFEWRWDQHQVKEFDELWKLGYNITTIAAFFKRDPDEVIVMALARARSGAIRDRAGGLFGTIT